MKKLYIAGIIALSAAMSSCNEFLTKDPLDSFTDTPTYWSNPSNLQYQCNTFLNQYSGYGNSGGSGWFYYQFRSDDQVNGDGSASNALNWAYTAVPGSSSYWNQPYIEARRAGYIIKGAQESGLDKSTVNNIIGIARLNRAWNFYQLVRMYGDVQWVDNVMEISDEGEVYGARQNRDVVMDNVLADLNFACENISATQKDRFNKDMAYAMKSQICLWEGTYAKYRKQQGNGQNADPARAEKYLNECVSACEYLLGRNYKLNEEYQTVYNSLSLTNDPEVIFYKPYAKNGFMHGIVDYTMNTSGTYGMSKDAFDNYLFLDGKPLATTTMDKSDAVAADGSLEALLAVRDKRLSQTIDPYIAAEGLPYSRWEAPAFTSYTGYGVSKYDNFNLEYTARTNTNLCYTDAPIYWIAVIYLDYAEAKAELGRLTDDDLNKTINKLYARAGLPNVTVASLNSMNDPANNMGVSSLIWEVRRARRCELMFDNWFRYWDLVRWHQLELLDNTKHPNVFLGANVKDVTAWNVDEKSGNQVKPNMNAEGYIEANNGQNRIFADRVYFYPVPSGQIALNLNLTQNPGW